MIATRDDRSLGELFAELSEETSTLIRKEIELARHEMSRSASTLAHESAMIAVGGLVAYIGGIVFMIGVAWLFVRLGMPEWLAFLLVGGVTAAAGAIAAYRAFRSVRNVGMVPRTVDTIKQDVDWAKDRSA